MADLVSKITFDVSQASQAIQALESTLASYDQQVDNLAKATQILNDKQQASGVTMRFINAQGRELVATIEDVNGVYKTTVKETQKLATADQTAAQAKKQITKVMKEQAAEAEKLAKAQKKQNDEMTRAIGLASRRAQADQLLGRITQPFQGQIATASPEKNLAVARAMDVVRDRITRGKMSIEEFEHAFTEFQRVGSAALVGLDRNVAGSVYNLSRSLANLGNTGQNAGQRILLTWAGVARIFVVQQIHRFVSLLSNEFMRATRESINFSLRIAEIQTISLRSGKSFQDWTRDVRALSDAFGVSNTVVAEGVYQGLSNQVITAANKTEFLTNAMKLSIATAATFDDGVNILSSAINSYGLSTTESARISGVFFKTVELGRVRLSEMANDFGTIGPLAKKLGITFEETNAMISSLTRTGIRYNEVNTIISSIMNELIKPSKELTELFQSLGVSSGEAAIKTFGFAGFMRILSQQSDLGSEHLATLFNNVRALRGIIGTTGDGLSEFEKDLKALRENGVDDLAEGFNKIADTDAKKLQIELNKLKNFFEIDLGIAFQSTLVNIIKQFGGLVQIVGEAASTTGGLVTAWALYRFGLRSGILDLGIFIANQVRSVYQTGLQTTATNLYTASLQRMRIAQVAASAYLAVITIAIGAWVKSLVDAEVAQAQLEQRISDFGNTLQQQSEREIELVRKTQEARVAATQEGLDKAVSAYVLYLAKITQVSNAVAAKAREGAEAAADAFKSYIDGITDRLRDAVSKAEAEVKRLESLRDQAQKNQSDIQTEAQKAKVERDLNVAQTPEEKAAVIQGEIDRINQALDAIIDRGAAASLEELEQARILAEQKEQYAKKLFDQEVEQSKALGKEEEKAKAEVARKQSQVLENELKQNENRLKRLLQTAKGGNILNLGVADQREARRLQAQIEAQKEAQKRLDDVLKAQEGFLARRDAAEKGINAAIQQRLDIERQITAEAEARRKAAENEAEALKQKTRNFDQQAEQFIKTKKDVEKTDFKVTESDPAKIKEQLDAQQVALVQRLETQKAALIEAAKNANIGGAQLIELERNVDSEITRIKEQAAADRIAVEAKALQQQAVAAVTAAKERLTTAKKEADDQVGIIEGVEDNVLKAANAVDERLKAIRERNNTFFGADLGADDVEKLNTIITKVEQINGNLRQQDKNNTVLQNADDSMRRLAELRTELKDLETGLNKSASKQSLEEIKTVRQAIVDAIVELQKSQGVQADVVKAQQNLAEAEAKAAELQKTLEAITPAAFAAAAAQGQMAQNTNDKLPALIARYKELVELLNKAAAVRGIAGVPKWFGGSMQFLASGGRGLDLIPAMLAKNEFVVNSKDSMKHYHQLVALNSGRQPRHFAQGGNVTTVGDINISVEGGQTPQSTVKEIGRLLKRQIRTGKLDLS